VLVIHVVGLAGDFISIEVTSVTDELSLFDDIWFEGVRA
jgi:hypothetical protein